VEDVQGLRPNTQAAEEEVDVGLEGVDGARRRESHGQAQAANNGQRKDAKHVAGGLSSGVEGVPYKVVVSEEGNCSKKHHASLGHMLYTS
jgi:hypothetical protein